MAPVSGDSTNKAVPGVQGANTAGGDGVVGGSSAGGRGVVGTSDTQAGVVGTSANFVGVWGESQSPASAGQPGVFGKSPNWQGVHGESINQVGVFGSSTNFVGVWGESQSPANAGQPGVFGKSPNWQGVHGESINQVGVFGSSTNFVGVWGESHSDNQPGVFGTSQKWQGVHGESQDQAGVVGISKNFVGVWGESQSATQPGVYGKGKLAAHFDGDVEVTTDIRLLNADCAEDFDVSNSADAPAGTVMVIDAAGALQPSRETYDKKVAGVVSGAGAYKPAIILDKHPDSAAARAPIALLGKVYCRVEANSTPIEVGDLLTTSSVPGHAMKAGDPFRAFGAVIGKALQPLREGTGLIPILIALQ